MSHNGTSLELPKPEAGDLFALNLNNCFTQLITSFN